MSCLLVQYFIVKLGLSFESDYVQAQLHATRVRWVFALIQNGVVILLT